MEVVQGRDLLTSGNIDDLNYWIPRFLPNTCMCTEVIGVTEQLWLVDKISVLLTSDCHISAIEDLSHKSLESCTRASVHTNTQIDRYNPPPTCSG